MYDSSKGVNRFWLLIAYSIGFGTRVLCAVGGSALTAVGFLVFRAETSGIYQCATKIMVSAPFLLFGLGFTVTSCFPIKKFALCLQGFILVSFLFVPAVFLREQFLYYSAWFIVTAGVIVFILRVIILSQLSDVYVKRNLSKFVWGSSNRWNGSKKC